jgi:hypothetical protein
MCVFFLYAHIFTKPQDWNSKKNLTLIDKIYLTTSNISTVGYGDYLPVTNNSRMFISIVHFVILTQLISFMSGNHEKVVIVKKITQIVIIQSFFIYVFVNFTNRDEWKFPKDNDTNDFQTMLYFTQTTFTTCGYGDMVPTTQKTKIITVLMHLIIMFHLI